MTTPDSAELCKRLRDFGGCAKRDGCGGCDECFALQAEAADRIEALEEQQRKHLNACRELDLPCLECEIEALERTIAAIQKLCDDFDPSDRLDPDSDVHNFRREVNKILYQAALAEGGKHGKD